MPGPASGIAAECSTTQPEASVCRAVTVTPAVDNTSAELRQELDTLRRHVDMLHAELAARWACVITHSFAAVRLHDVESEAWLQ